jgi:hypothetical protein
MSVLCALSHSEVARGTDAGARHARILRQNTGMRPADRVIARQTDI